MCFEINLGLKFAAVDCPKNAVNGMAGGGYKTKNPPDRGGFLHAVGFG